MNEGVVRTIKDLVVTVQFDDDVPLAGEILVVQNQFKSQLLVDSLQADSLAICLNIESDRSLQKGMIVSRTGKGPEIPTGPKTVGRVFDALGRPIDGQPAPEGEGVKRKQIFKLPSRSTDFTLAKPEILETGVKVIDFFTPFVKGRKIGIIGGAGVGKTVLTMELINNVAKSGKALGFFAGIGERIREGHELYETLQANDILKNTCMFFGQMNENPVQRALVGISATSLAEYFRDEEGKDVLFFADNMYRYVQARNELATLLDQIPAEGGYEPTIFSDVKTLQDRLNSNEKGSITAVQTIYVPADDMSDPAVQMIQHELDSIIVLSRAVAEQGIRPAVDLIHSTSSLLTPEVVGDRHYVLSLQVQELLQKHASLKNIIAIIGESELSPADRADYAKAKQLIQYFNQNLFVTSSQTGQKGESFSREETLKGVEEIIV